MDDNEIRNNRRKTGAYQLCVAMRASNLSMYIVAYLSAWVNCDVDKSVLIVCDLQDQQRSTWGKVSEKKRTQGPLMKKSQILGVGLGSG